MSLHADCLYNLHELQRFFSKIENHITIKSIRKTENSNH